MTQDRIVYLLPRALLMMCLAAAGMLQRSAAADETDRKRHCERSAHFLLHTDLPRERATSLLESMEQTLVETEDYWRRPVRGMIECYVVDDLGNWPDNTLPHPLARVVIDRIGGVTLIDQQGAGIQTRNKVTVIASSRPGVAEHEVVHAYCGLVFGVTGPAWYREGIAQVFAYSQGEGKGMHCPPELLEDLTGKQGKPLREIMKREEFSKQLVGSLTRKMNQGERFGGLAPLNRWNQSDIETLDRLKREYAWSWVACHLLFHNPNYQSRFKSLGNSYLADRQDELNRLFGPVMDQLAFEYDLTVRHFTPGYRVDLCRWDWDKRFSCLRSGRPQRVRIDAARGYQASGLAVRGGKRYRVSTDGTWHIDSSGSATTADGDAQGHGRLEAILMWRYQLTEPFELGADCEFRAPADGLLYLRCRDNWAQLGDNDGNILVTLERAR